ncbi:MAG: hypothetical protein COX57_12795 [Alphaproteobacteria bacterium CG_4_10_14_0_2_um_filter_63_37]|nr:MAG: hypothetical protein AUJ55_08275 [Proteobacteria bacterium CG1_02_64_396]PJA23584.1 MAG: hypothetical protein COX57_12795 [Alphaproteobacteria bacterium CG_4_10_14_0_2_um_filter_63_37]
MSERHLLAMTAPMREDFTIPYHDIGAGDLPVDVALVGGVHGNEINAISVLSRLSAFLRGIVEGRYPGLSFKGRVLIVPAINVLGVNTRHRDWPFDGTDINRMYPGTPFGETTQRIAYQVLALTKPARYRIDVHSSNLDFEELPQVRLFEGSDAERATAQHFNLPAVVEYPVSRAYTTSLNVAWKPWPGQNFVLVGGQAGYLQSDHCSRMINGLTAFLSKIGLIEGLDPDRDGENVHHFGLGQVYPLISEGAGLFVPRVTVGRWLRQGEGLGTVFDAFDGRAIAEIFAPCSGLLTGIRRQPLMCQGDLVARIHSLAATERDFGWLEPHGQ